MKRILGIAFLGLVVCALVVVFRTLTYGAADYRADEIALPDAPAFDVDQAARHLSEAIQARTCLLYTSPSPRDLSTSRMPSSA